MSRTVRAVAGVALIGVAVGIASGWAWSAEATANADVEGESDSGVRDIEITEEPGADHVLDINADSGSVTVQYG